MIKQNQRKGKHLLLIHEQMQGLMCTFHFVLGTSAVSLFFLRLIDDTGMHHLARYEVAFEHRTQPRLQAN